MFFWFLRRVALLAVTLLGIAALTFALTRLTPGDPAALKVGGATGSASAAGAYDDIVELNRRNLGLDRPLLLNLRFEDAQWHAHRAIDDLFREAEFWREDGERRLVRQSTLALRAAVERYALIGKPNEPMPTNSNGRPPEVADAEERRRRLEEVFPSLVRGHEVSEYAAWEQQQRPRWAPPAVEATVHEFLTATDPAVLEERRGAVLALGGFAVAPLMHALEDDAQTARASDALAALTGLSFAATDASQFHAAEVRARWRSWWRREHLAWTFPSPAAHAFHVVANTQFGLWLAQAATLDFGDSYIKKKPVLTLIAQALPVSVTLSLLSILIAYLIAVPLGIYSALHRHTPSDALLTVILFVLYSLPSFWVAGILLLTTTGEPFLNWFPTRGLNTIGRHWGAEGVTGWSWFLDRLWHLILPLTCLTYGSLAFIARQTRAAMLETINEDFVRTARAKGLNPIRVVLVHTLRNALIPLIAISSTILPELIAGAVLIESIFSIPGMGLLTFDSIVNRDYPVINAVLFFSAFLTLLSILVADVCYAVADPRIRYQ